MITAVFFDLDGTLADTAPDLAAALNQLLGERGRPSLPFDVIRPVVSHGGNALLRLAFAITEDQPEFEGLRQRYLELYDRRLHYSTSFFPGIPEVLETLETEGIRWGVITNKPAWLTHPLMHKLGVERRVACIVSGDSTGHRKPHPAPVLHACEITGVDPRASLYVGDAERDIAAGRAAGLHTLIACYGYIGKEEDPSQWQADGMIDHPQEIIDWVHAFQARS
jgi:N-acetyl-D-muramate 6-phosphate phosphatase